MRYLLIMLTGVLAFVGAVYAADGDLVVNGKLGIGTTTPETKLDVRGSVNVSNNDGTAKHRISIGGSAGNYGEIGYGFNFTNTNNSWNYAVSDYASMIDFNLGGFLFRTAPNGIVGNPVSFTTAMTILQNGNVGIGTTAPTARLDVSTGNIDYNASAMRITNTKAAGQSPLDFYINGMLRGKYRVDYLGNVVSVANGGGFYFITGGDYGTGAVRMLILPSGNVGIGTEHPQYTLDVAGTIRANNVSPSDIRFKENVVPVDSALAKVLNIQGVSFDWKREEFKDKHFPEGRHYGVIAQEIETVLPEVVNNAPDGTKSVAYTEIIPVLIEAIKEQQKEIMQQRKDIAQLKRIIDGKQ